MKSRVAAGVLFVTALVVYGGVALPLRHGAAAAADEFRRLRDQRRDAWARLAQLERRESFRRRAASVFSAGGKASGGTVRVVRRSVVSSLEGAGVSAVTLAVRPGTPPVAAAVRVSAEGSFPEVVRLSGHVVRPGTGLILERVRFSPRSPRVELQLEAVGLGGRS